MKSLLHFLLLLAPFTLASQVKTTKVSIEGATKEIKENYYVTKSAEQVKHGTYEYIYSGKKLISGMYSNGLKDGEWIYTPSKSFTIVGNYQNDEKTGTWVYLNNKDTLSILQYSHGELEGQQLGLQADGALASRSVYKNGQQEGITELYYPDGTLKETTNYKNGKLDGESVLYSASNQLAYRFTFQSGALVSFEKGTDTLEKIGFEGEFIQGTGYIESYKADSEGRKHLTQHVEFKDSLKHGEAYGKDSLGNYTFKGQFSNGILCGEWYFYKSDGTVYDTVQYTVSDSIVKDTMKHYTTCDIRLNEDTKMPEFNGGQLGLRKFIANTVTYPEICREMDIQGRVYVEFTIDRVGAITDVKIVRSVHPKLDKEAHRVIAAVPPIVPGFMNGIPGKVKYTLPINFKLSK